MSQREIFDTFSGGSELLGPPDGIEDRKLRFIKNARLTEQRGVISSRPGITKQSAAEITTSVTMLHKRFDTAGNSTYQQSGTTLYRRSATWTGATVLSAATGTAQLSAANMVDGKGGVWAYFNNNTLRSKDNGTSLTNWGIAAPANPPSAVALAADLTTTIDLMNAAASWTGAGLSAGPTDDVNVKIEGAGSVTFTIAAGGLGSIGQGGFALNLDTLTGGDNTVKDDDYIHLWLRCDRPERVLYVQLDFDLDTTTLANAFRTNYYSIRLPGLSRLNQGTNQWTKLQPRKSEFQRFGTSADDWGDVKSVRISALVNSDGAVQFWADDFKLRGGTDIEGDVEYCLAYRNNTTGARGNPALDSTTAAVRYTTALAVDRQRTSITITNVREGGVDHPGDTQITHMILYRRINGGNSVNIDEFVDTTANPYVDDVSVAATVLNGVLESTIDSPGNEAENDRPLLGDVIFGPGATNRLFMLQGANRLYFSKSWEKNENRAENWPPNNFALVGDGSQRALAGVVSDTQIIVCTDAATYQVFGSGEDTFLPVPIPNSRGIVGRNAIDDGDGRIFIFSPDGLVEQVGNQQLLVVPMGEVLGGADIAINTSPTALASIWVRWHQDSHVPYVRVLIPTGSSTTPSASLVVKKNLETGRYTDVILDTHSVTWTALFADDAASTLFAGNTGGDVFKIEDHTTFSDVGSSIAVDVRTKSYHSGQPHRDKQYSQIVVETNTRSTTLNVTAMYDKESATDAAEPVSTSTVVGTGFAIADTPLAMHRDIALRMQANMTAQLLIYRFGWYAEIQAEAVIFWDSGVHLFPTIEPLKRLDFDINASAVVTATPYYDGVAGDPLIVLPTTGRQHAFPFFPPSKKVRTFRLTLSSAGVFRLYGLTVRNKYLGAIFGYTQAPMIKGAQT